MPLIDGGTSRLPQLVGLSRALDLILTGREIKAKEALEIGLVNRICDTGSGEALLLCACVHGERTLLVELLLKEKCFLDKLFHFETEINLSHAP